MSFAEVQYFEGSFTSSIYSACSFKEVEQNHLLYASRTQVLCLGSEWGNYSLQQLSPVAIPEDATIISIDAFHQSPSAAYSPRSSSKDSLVVLLGFHKPPAAPTTVFSTTSPEPKYDLGGASTLETPNLPLANLKNLNRAHSPPAAGVPVPTERPVNASQLNVYCAHEYEEFGENLQSDLTSIFSSVRQRIELEFLPARIVHTLVPSVQAGIQRRIVLVAGSDEKVHFFTKRTSKDRANPAFTPKATPGEAQVAEAQTSSDSITVGKETATGGVTPSSLGKPRDFEELGAAGEPDHVGFGYRAGSMHEHEGRYLSSEDRRATFSFEHYPSPIPQLNTLGSAPLSLTTSNCVSGGAGSSVLGVGCRNGTLHVFQTDYNTSPNSGQGFGKKQVDSLNGPLPTLEIVENGLDNLDVVVGGALGFAAVYHDITNTGLDAQDPVILPKSRLYDSVLCSHVADLSWDGCQNIAIGTYGQELLVYEKIKEGQGLREKKDHSTLFDSSVDATGEGSGQYRVKWQRTFAHPLYSIDTGDFNQDGVDELVVNSLRGIHILQPDLEAAADKILLEVSRFSELKELSSALEVEPSIVSPSQPSD